MKMTSRIMLLRWLAGVDQAILLIATLALMHSTAEYCAPVWCRSAHTRLIDPAINDTLQIVIGCVRPTPADNLPTFADIQPGELRRNGATLSPARRAMEPGHLLHSALTCPSSANARGIKLRHPFLSAAQHLISFSENNNIRAARWAPMECRVDGQPHKTLHFHPQHRHPPPRMTLPRRGGVHLYHL